MDRLPKFSDYVSVMNKDEMNWAFLLFTAAVFIFALLCVICLICGIRCCLRRRRGAHPHEQNPLIVTTKAAPIAVDTTDLDYIDSRETKVISSTVQVNSLHNSPISSA